MLGENGLEKIEEGMDIGQISKVVDRNLSKIQESIEIYESTIKLLTAFGMSNTPLVLEMKKTIVKWKTGNRKLKKEFYKMIESTIKGTIK